MRPTKSRTWFTRLTKATAHVVGRPVSFTVAIGMVALWAMTGPLFGFSDTWQLVINTATTVLTFLMVFVLQHSQNRDAIAIQAKLDELILHTKHARNDLIEAEKLTEQELEILREHRIKHGRALPTGEARR